jgi:hypothetical protein
MKFNPQIATGRAECKKCGEVIEKGKPCLELSYNGGRFRAKDKVCLPCLEVITADVIYAGVQHNNTLKVIDALPDMVRRLNWKQQGGLTHA